MSNQRSVAIVILATLSALFLVWFFLHRREQAGPEKPAIEKIHGGPCPGETKTLVLEDVYLKGLIEKGEEYQVIINYFDCNAPKRGDLALFAFSNSLEPVVKRIVAIEGDKFRLLKDKKRKAWNLEVNGELVRSVLDDHEPYFFGTDQAPSTLNLFENSRSGKMRKGEVILFSSWPPGDRDGGVFGVTSLVDVIGKAIPNKAE